MTDISANCSGGGNFQPCPSCQRGSGEAAHSAGTARQHAALREWPAGLHSGARSHGLIPAMMHHQSPQMQVRSGHICLPVVALVTCAPHFPTTLSQRQVRRNEQHKDPALVLHASVNHPCGFVLAKLLSLSQPLARIQTAAAVAAAASHARAARATSTALQHHCATCARSAWHSWT